MEEQHLATILTDANFNDEVKNFDGLVLVDFWAEWCGPCQIMKPRIEELAKKYAGNPHIKIAELDVDANPATAMEYRVMSLPSFKLLSKGVLVDEMIGAVPAPELDKMIERVLPKAQTAAAA